MPLDYTDVFRFTARNVRSKSHLVDCWVSDPNSDQNKGLWIGTTICNVRIMVPKKGWVIQNGRPTQVEETTSRPEHIWVEVWRYMSKKKQQYVLASVAS